MEWDHNIIDFICRVFVCRWVQHYSLISIANYKHRKNIKIQLQTFMLSSIMKIYSLCSMSSRISNDSYRLALYESLDVYYINLTSCYKKIIFYEKPPRLWSYDLLNFTLHELIQCFKNIYALTDFSSLCNFHFLIYTVETVCV